MVRVLVDVGGDETELAAWLEHPEALCKHCLSLPIYPELSKEKISRVASVLLDLENR